MSAYYSTLNNSSGNTIPGNFGISNAIRIGVQGNVPNYNYGLNNAGLLPPSAAVSTQTNVLMGLLSGKDASGFNATATALAQSAQQAVTLIPIDTKFNGNVPNPTHPRIQAYPNETSFNTYQN
jgi:hypothetical protein